MDEINEAMRRKAIKNEGEMTTDDLIQELMINMQSKKEGK